VKTVVKLKNCSGGYKQSKLKLFFQPQNFANIGQSIKISAMWYYHA
jgi:hypothetical protein